MSPNGNRNYDGSEIALVGMACRLPGATDIETFWRNLLQGLETLTELSDEDLARAGVDPELARDPRYVRRASVLDDIEGFDAEFFGITPPEARLTDPQHRLFLECAWESLERGGYDPAAYSGPIGVFTGAKTNTYLFSLFSNQELFRSLDTFQIALGNDLASLATRVSYKLDLRGPSYALHTACSTSLVTVHLAIQSLLLGECDMALAGGAAVNVPQRKGYIAPTGGILSPDGSCRTFDAEAAGSNFGNGVGCVLLKRLADAQADGDHIHAVIRGSATNNDGSLKASYTAPGVEGQTAVLLEAMAASGVRADDLSYIEAHGTATELGDAIEILALKQAFSADTERKSFCALGSVKTNLGHLETAAGVTGLIKTALALEHEVLPPSLHFDTPNPQIGLEDSPFYVVTEATPWPRGETPRRAGVSSFGIGSTNAHVILEEPPPVPEAASSRPWQLLPLAARTESALDTMTRNLAEHLESHPDQPLADVAYTLQVGRRRFAHRRVVVARDREDAVGALTGDQPRRRPTLEMEEDDRSVAFLLPGLGDHYPGMGRDLYENEPEFRRHLDRCAEILEPLLGEDVRRRLYADGDTAQGEADKGAGGLDLRAMLGRGAGASGSADDRLADTRVAQPVVFAVEYALARLWMSWGVRPTALLGYSLGEYVAACLAGVLTLEDALKLVAERARLIDDTEPGRMLAVPRGEDAVAALVADHGLSLAAVNGPDNTVLAGTAEAVEAARAALENQGVAAQVLQNTHAFHSHLLEPAAEALTDLARGFETHAPEIPYLSNVTGTWVTAEDAADPAYWARHMVGTVRFAEGLDVLLADPRRVLLEVGPGQGLSSFARLHPACPKERAGAVVASMRQSYGTGDDQAVLLEALGRLWMAGATLDWAAFYGDETRRRVPLPTYPFERRRHWVDLPGVEGALAKAPAPKELTKEDDPASWLYLPQWREETLEAGEALSADGCWWLFDTEATGSDLGRALEARLREAGDVDVVRIVPGDGFKRVSDRVYRVAPGSVEDYGVLYEDLVSRGRRPRRVVHLWSVTGALPSSDAETFAARQELGYHSLVFAAQALANGGLTGGLDWTVVGDHLLGPDDEAPPSPEKATVLGAAVVLPQEHPSWVVRTVDVTGAGNAAETAGHLLAEITAETVEAQVALRGDRRLVRRFDHESLPERPEGESPFRDGGTYLITGGMGGIGQVLSRHLAERHGANLVLLRRSAVPEGTPAADAADPVLREIHALEELGGSVLALQADVTDRERMAAAVAAAKERFGALTGVIHAAGELAADTFKTAQQLGRDASERQFAPKVHGLYVLEDVLRGEDLDFCFLYSSLSSILGGLGYAPYATANLFMDVFARHRRHPRNGAVGGETALPWRSVDWDSWHYEGFGDNDSGVGATLTELAMTPDEGVDVLERLLLRPWEGDVVISTGELQPRLDRWVRSRRPETAGAVDRVRVGGGADLGSGEELEGRIGAVWARLLGVDHVARDENFFDLGGNSLLGMQLVGDLQRELGVDVTPVMLFEAPTVAALTERLAPAAPTAPAAKDRTSRRGRRANGDGDGDIAVISMVGRLPGARNVDEFWRNLSGGVESITFFSDDELLENGTDPATLSDPSFVKARPILRDVDRFDAAFFGYSPREAEVMDPQHRLFLEAAWEALELAGYDSERLEDPVGVYAGASISSYMANIYSNPELVDQVGTFQTLIGNEKDSLTTKVSYKMNLRGPSLAVQTFCSTSLVAVHLARQALLAGDCDMALAGGVSVIVPEVSGYHYQEGGIGSVDGHIRAFDAGGSGIVFGNGLGIVVLKRLDDALADGDPIHAVIKASAVNNDGTVKAGYSATSVEGQSKVVGSALEESGVHPEAIQYMEAHGTGTPLGDPIEVAALTRAFRGSTDRVGFCALGSAKTNVGHLDRAAGVTGLIKTILALRHRQIPPSLHFEVPNPKIDFAGSPFFVNTELRPWEAPADGPRRAGVNSLGLGGTNAHVVLEEAPEREPSGPSRPWQLLPVSAKTATALEAATARLADHLESDPDTPLADVAYTLQVGRTAMAHRRAVVCRDAQEAVALLRGETPRGRVDGFKGSRSRPVTFLFPGLGGQYVDMGRGLYEAEPVFRDAVDRCAEVLETHLGTDLRATLYPEERERTEEPAKLDLKAMLGRGDAAPESAAAQRLADTRLLQPALFVVEYALATQWRAWGVEPDALLGYSLGELVAATLAGVMELDDALELVAARAQLIEELPEGRMLAVPLPEETVLPLLGDDLSLAAVNGPSQSVVAGSPEAVAALEERLDADGVASRRLETRHAFHSHMLRPAFDDLVERVSRMDLQAPRIPYLSNVTGEWITAEEATDPTYWARHMCQPVRFSRSVETLLETPGRVLLEMGPGQTLGSLVLQHPAGDAAAQDGPAAEVIASLPHVYERRPDPAALLDALARLWAAGVPFDARAFWDEEDRRRVLLPTYPFERESFWVEATEDTSVVARRRLNNIRQRTVADAFQAPSWRRAGPVPPAVAPDPERRWVVLADAASGGLARAVAAHLPGAEDALFLGPDEDPAMAFEAAGLDPSRPVDVISARPLAGDGGADDAAALLALLSATEAEDAPRHRVWFLTPELHAVYGHETGDPDAAALVAVARADGRCRQIDVQTIAPGSVAFDRLAARVAAEIAADSLGGGEPVVALRAGHRWLPDLEPLLAHLGDARAQTPTGLDPSGVADPVRVLLAGGQEGLGAAFAEVLSALGDTVTGVTTPPGDPAGLAATVAAATEAHGPFDQVLYLVEAGLTAADLQALEQTVASWPRPEGRPRVVHTLARTDDHPAGARAAVVADAFAQRREAGEPVADDVNWTSVAWDPALEATQVLPLLRALPPLPQVVVSKRALRDPWERFVARKPRLGADTAAAQTLYPRPALEVAYAEPRDELERSLAKIWEDLLGVERVGIHDGFLELGGDSLIAARLVARMRDELDTEIPIRLFFERSTVGELSEAIRELRRQEESDAAETLLAQVEGLSDEELEAQILQLELEEERGE